MLWCSLTGDNPCLNGGVCTDAIGHPICDCPAPLASDDAGDVCADECSPNPCLSGGVCTDGIGSYTCDCATGFCGPTCADPWDRSQNGPQCPCEDDPAWVDTRYGQTCDGGCPSGVDAAGVTAAEACPVACQSGCSLTYDDCCESSASSPIQLGQ